MGHAEGQAIGPFSTPDDLRLCRALLKQHGTTYYWSSRLFAPEARRHVEALYGFVRVPDEWVDNPRGLSLGERERLLVDFETQLVDAVLGRSCPDHPVMRAFVDTMIATGMELDEPLCFLAAMKADLTVTRYPTYQDLAGYMRGSASAVGLMMLEVLGVKAEGQVREDAMALGEAMQLTNFLRDVSEDVGRDRIYLPLEDMERFGVSESQILARSMSPSLAALIEFEAGRARSLYAQSDRSIEVLQADARRAVRSARILYSRILDRLEMQGWDVFAGRARTGRLEKLATAARLALSKT